MPVKAVPIAPFFVVSLLSTAALAAPQTKTGEIKSTDVAKHEFVLASGEIFEAGSKINLKKIKAGDRVKVIYALKGGKMVASKVKPAK